MSDPSGTAKVPNQTVNMALPRPTTTDQEARATEG